MGFSKKIDVLNRVTEAGLVAVVRAESAEQAIRITDACIEGGVGAIEITYTVPGATAIIEELSRRYAQNGSIILGAGTCLDPETARVAILAGAQYVVSPYLNIETIKLCNRYAVPCMPGIMTVAEAVLAMENGADLLKLFPGEAFGPGIVKAFKGPLPQANFMPTGGVSAENVHTWIKNGCVAVGVGGNLIAGAKTGDYASITAAAKDFVAKIKEARGK